MRQVNIDEIKKLSLKIEGLWREQNVFEWNLNLDVNILSGSNGSGKSTILRILYAILTGKSAYLHSSLETFYPDGMDEEHYLYYKDYEKISFTLNKTKIEIKNAFFYPDSFINDIADSLKNIPIDLFATLDQRAVSKEDIQGISKHNINIQSQIDYDLYQHQILYTKYLLTVSKRAEKAYKEGDKIEEKLTAVYAQKNLFFEIIDNLFAETFKKIDRENDEVQFVKNEKTTLSVYQLSSGEKQMFLILLTALLQDNRQSIYLLDEPEISLHPDWQENLIDNIRKINPNVLLVIATHSPDIIVNGWQNKVVDMRDLLKPLMPEKQYEP